MSNNPYEQLVDYFQKQNVPKKKSVIPVTEKKVEKSETKKLLEESKFHKYTPSYETHTNKSDGFNLSSFETMMKAKLIEEYKKLQSYERPYISVSELYTCIRQCYYTRMKYPVDLNKLYNFAYLYMIQKVGNTIHDVIQGLYNFSEVEKTIISNSFKVKGRVDAISDRFLYEIKSIDVEKFKNKYIDEHYFQGCIYAYILNNDYNYKIDTITIIYTLRNLKKVVPYDLPIDNKIAESFLSKAPILLSSIETHQVPEPFNSNDESCRYCSFKQYCEKDECKVIIPPYKKEKTVTKQEKQIYNNPKQEKQISDKKKTAFLL